MVKIASACVTTCMLIVMIGAIPARAESVSPADREFFETKIRPVLVKHCYECHAADAKELGGKLLLDSRDGMLQGGESGPVVVAGKPAASLLIQALRYDGVEMPPEKPLAEVVIRDFQTWIARGAPDPRSPTKTPETNADDDKLAAEELWSFRPRTSVDIPTVRDTTWPRDPLDNFILAPIEATGVKLATRCGCSDSGPSPLLRSHRLTPFARTGCCICRPFSPRSHRSGGESG